MLRSRGWSRRRAIAHRSRRKPAAPSTAITVTENEQRVVDLVLKKTAGY
ncbi:MAG TPA: hypothetical protein VKH34_11210 [Vicinamibacterales bacterium]|nr:hypothetical protein [Vicinamibacterales bacterium]